MQNIKPEKPLDYVSVTARQKWTLSDKLALWVPVLCLLAIALIIAGYQITRAWAAYCFLRSL